MATNEYVNKVVYGGNTIIDLTGDDVQESDVRAGVKFHLPSGEPSTGTGSGGGGGPNYTRTVICPQQTVTPDGNRSAILSDFSPLLIDGEFYIVTYDGTEWLCTCETQWSNVQCIGELMIAYGVPSEPMCPFLVVTSAIDGGGELVALDSNQHTVKVERLELTGGSGGGSIIITDEQDSHGGIVRTITAVEISGTKQITANGTGIDVTEYAAVDVAVPSSAPNLQAKTGINPSTSSQTIQADSGYDGLSSVQINAMPNGTAGTPTATKGSVSNHSVTVTPSVTNTTGYITGSTKTGTGVTVSASELVSGNLAVTQNGNNIDCANYSTVSVNVPTGSSKTLYKYEGLASRTANSYGATNAKVTVAKAGTYNISYVAIRGSSSGTMGTNLHIGATEKGNNTTWSNGTYGQYVSYTNQNIAANTDVTIYATSGNASRTIYVGQLIVEEV